MQKDKVIRIGWAQVDITPGEPVLVAGQFHARVSEGVIDPLTATVLALEAPAGTEKAILVSCDLVSISTPLRDKVRAVVHARLPEIPPEAVCLNATHTHTAPLVRVGAESLRPGRDDEGGFGRYGLSNEELGVMDPEAYVALVAERIVAAVERAWRDRAPGGIGFALGQAVVGRNRRLAYYGGESRMYGRADDPGFSHVEGDCDHDINLLGTFDSREKLTGLVVNIACPAQVSEHEFLLSADYWHETREELRRRLGEKLFVLPQCAPAGDQSPHVLLNQRAEARVLRLKGLIDDGVTPDKNLGSTAALRREIAGRIASGVEAVLPCLSAEIETAPAFVRKVETIAVSRNRLSRADADEALAAAAEWESKYEALRAELAAHPEKKNAPRWYVDITRTYSRARWFRGVVNRFELQEREKTLPVELTVLRLGEMAVATDPFEFYLDYSQQIKSRSRALQTFTVQLAGTGTYVPTGRATAGRSYGAVPASNPIGPDGGREVVEATLEMINGLWPENED